MTINTEIWAIAATKLIRIMSREITIWVLFDGAYSYKYDKEGDRTTQMEIVTEVVTKYEYGRCYRLTAAMNDINRDKEISVKFEIINVADEMIQNKIDLIEGCH